MTELGQGEWKLRNGDKAIIKGRIQVGPSKLGWGWYGTINERYAQWRHNGLSFDASEYDISAPWQSPAAPPLTIEPGEFQTRDGCKAVVEGETVLAGNKWYGRCGGAERLYWEADGSYGASIDPSAHHAMDLIARWPQPAAEKEQIEIKDGDKILVEGVVRKAYPRDDDFVAVQFNMSSPLNIPVSAIHSIIERAPVDPQPGDVVTWDDTTQQWNVLAADGDALWIRSGTTKEHETALLYIMRKKPGFRIVKRAGK